MTLLPPLFKIVSSCLRLLPTSCSTSRRNASFVWTDLTIIISFAAADFWPNSFKWITFEKCRDHQTENGNIPKVSKRDPLVPGWCILMDQHHFAFPTNTQRKTIVAFTKPLKRGNRRRFVLLCATNSKCAWRPNAYFVKCFLVIFGTDGFIDGMTDEWCAFRVSQVKLPNTHNVLLANARVFGRWLICRVWDRCLSRLWSNICGLIGCLFGGELRAQWTNDNEVIANMCKQCLVKIDRRI